MTPLATSKVSRKVGELINEMQFYLKKGKKETKGSWGK